MAPLQTFLLSFALCAFVPSISAQQACNGCRGDAGPVGADAAGSPCVGSPGTVAGDWVIEVIVDVTDGFCALKQAELAQTCAGRPCSNNVSYSWGKAVAAGGIDIGYYHPDNYYEPTTYYYFPDGDPWVPGLPDTFYVGPESSPATACGAHTVFFMQSHNCGEQLAQTISTCEGCS